MTFYYLPGVEQPIVRATWGPSKEDIATKRQYARTRENLSESIGRGKAVSGLMKAFQPLKPLADPDTAGQFNRLLRAVQTGDTVSANGWPSRSILDSKNILPVCETAQGRCNNGHEPR